MRIITKIVCAFIFLISFSTTFSYGQACICPVDNIVINTGYDPNTLTSVAPGTAAPRWIVSGITPACSAIGGASLVGANATAINRHPAWLVVPPGSPHSWISFGNFSNYGTAGAGVFDGTYVATFTREFELCHEADVTINMQFAFDNGIDIYLDGTTTTPIWSRYTTLNTATYSRLQPTIPIATGPSVPFIHTVHLAAGIHTLDFVVENWAITNPTNAHGLLVIGTISTPGNDLAHEGPLPGVVPIAGLTPTFNLCVGDSRSNAALPGSTAGGTYSSSNTAVATVDGAGMVNGVAIGTAIITYSVTTTCGTAIATTTVNVIPPPTVTLTATPDVICSGDPVTLTATITPIGGSYIYYWDDGSMSYPFMSIVVTPIVTSIYSFTADDGGCSTTRTITVNVHPAPMPIVGPSALCIGDMATFTCTPSGGTWSSSNPSIAPVASGTGVVTGSSAGIAIISYTNPDGCLSTKPVTIDPIPDIIGPDRICELETRPYSSSFPGGTWSSSAPGTADFSTGPGMLTGYTSGTVIITYTLGACIATKTVTVSGTPPTVTVDRSTVGYGPFFKINVTGGTCDNYTVDYDIYLNACEFPGCSGCGRMGPVSKSMVMTSGTYVEFEYMYLENDATTGIGSTGGAISTPPYDHSAYPITSTGCDPRTRAAYLTVPDWGIYKLCVTNVSGCGCSWPVFTCAVGKSAPSTNPVTVNMPLALTPNPTAGSFTISGSLPSVKTTEEATIEVTDLLGKVVYTNTTAIEDGRINAEVTLGSEIANGIYFVRIKNAEVNEVIKFTLDR